MARLVQHPTKYTPEDWHRSNKINYSQAERERRTAEMIRDESARLRQETHITTLKTQSDVNKKLDQRILDVDFWKSELDRLHGETDDEINTLLQYKDRLEKALDATQVPIQISQQCLKNREERSKIDLVHDDVEIQLMKEVEVIGGVQALVKKTLDQATEQIRLLRSAKYYLEKDITDKFSALSIDNTCAELQNDTPGTYYAPKAVKIESNSVTPDEWQSFSDKNFLKAERECNSSKTMRSMIDEILQQVYNDQQKQCTTVNLAFKKRIEETEKAKTKLEEHHAHVMGEIREMELNIDDLEQAIKEKEAPLKVTHTRLDNRTRRPNVELCRDHVQYRLVNEAGEIMYNIERLKEMLKQSENAMKALVRSELSLSEDIEVKIKSLFIDRDQNMVLRRQIDHKLF
eukprot:gene14263-15750_t